MEMDCALQTVVIINLCNVSCHVFAGQLQSRLHGTQHSRQSTDTHTAHREGHEITDGVPQQCFSAGTERFSLYALAHADRPMNRTAKTSGIFVCALVRRHETSAEWSHIAAQWAFRRNCGDSRHGAWFDKKRTSQCFWSSLSLDEAHLEHACDSRGGICHPAQPSRCHACRNE